VHEHTDEHVNYEGNGAHSGEEEDQHLHQEEADSKIGFNPDQTYAVHGQGNTPAMHMSMKTTLEMKEFDL
jgi:hypothetical protein